MSIPRSYLYVPGDRPDRLAKAASRGADAIIADLEDAVAPAAKDRARDEVADWLDAISDGGPPGGTPRGLPGGTPGGTQGGTPAGGTPGGTQIWVRVNGGERRADDLLAVVGHPRLTGILLPKVDHPDEIAAAAATLPDGVAVRWAPMIESAVGLVHIHDIAAARNVHQLHLGEMDLAADLGLTPTRSERELLYARSLLVIASRAAGLVPPAAPVSAEIDDLDRFEQTTRRLDALGFVGRDCIHPAQVAVANAVFSPSGDDIAWATEVLARAEAGLGAFRDSRRAMVDEAVLRRARRIVGGTGSVA